MISLIASVFFAAATPAQEEPSVMEALSEKPVFSENATAREMIDGCRSMIPADVEIRGHINRRSRRGTEVAAYRYILKRSNGKTDLKIFDKNGKSVEFKKEGRLLDTDITWSDLTLDYLWWNDI